MQSCEVSSTKRSWHEQIGPCLFAEVEAGFAKRRIGNRQSPIGNCPMLVNSDKALRNAHPPQQVGEARVAADWIPHRIVFNKICDRSRR